MTDNDAAVNIHQLEGSVDVLSILTEEFAQWAEEAQDKSKLEALENVLRHVETMEREYKRRLADARRA